MRRRSEGRRQRCRRMKRSESRRRYRETEIREGWGGDTRRGGEERWRRWSGGRATGCRIGVRWISGKVRSTSFPQVSLVTSYSIVSCTF